MKYLNKRNTTFLSIGVVFFLVFLVMQVPASFGWSFVPPHLKKQIQLNGLQGSIWNGSAATSLINGQDTGHLRWQLSPFYLFIGKVGVSFSLVGKSGSLSGDVLMNETTLSLSNIKTSLQASYLNIYLARRLPLPVMLQGKINAKLDSLYFERGKQIQLTGSILWKNAEVQGIQNFPLGDVTINADKTDSGSAIKLTNKDNPLDIKGNLILNLGGQYDLNIGLLNRDKSRKDLNDMLSFLGQPEADGRYHFKQKGVLPLQF